MAGASMNTIKTRIRSVESTMQITRAMELVATSKLRRAKERAEGIKPYMSALLNTVGAIGTVCGEETSPLISKPREGARTLYIVIAGDRGLAGGYNSNIFKLAAAEDKDRRGIYVPIGKKAADHFTRKGFDIFSRDLPEAAEVGVGDAFLMADKIINAVLSGEIGEVKLIYTKFVSMLVQAPTREELLPLSDIGGTKDEPIYEGDTDALIAAVIKQYIGGVIYSAVCESVAAECAARRSAMSSANKNAEEMISDLRLKFNRARQAVITQEITEIVSGAEAL
ncbi:MAG: ATP synthase F1 subunit gamma [Clostridia bacterium]|nr:ATP synthase F1 subunit gamma [Clostridia bacterium]